MTNFKSQINTKDQIPKEKVYDLEERTFLFAKNVAKFCLQLKKDDINYIYIKQVVRSSSSVGANYIEANESLGDKDFKLRIKTCRKEAKETAYWLRLIIAANSSVETEAIALYNEAIELKKIFSAIANKSIGN